MRVLIADDDRSLARVLELTMQDEGHRTIVSFEGKGCLDLLKKESFDVCILDLNMPNMSGLEVLEAFRGKPPCPIIVLTAYEQVELAVRAMKNGAFDYLTKPYDRQKLLRSMELAHSHQSLKVENEKLRTQLSRERVRNYVKPQEGKYAKLLDFAAGSDTTVMLLGQTGVGKEYAARYIHDHSRRGLEPFVAVNCAAIPENLLESEIFGHSKGAFTSASEDRKGLLEEAGEGTFFLDEIGDLPLSLQGKLLRVIEERRYRRLGESREREFKGRLFCASHQNLPKMIREKGFREDLYYRLNTFPIEIPPLRERTQELGSFLNHFLPETHFMPDALQYLQGKNWTGNLRELRNYCSRIAVFYASSTAISKENLEGIEAMLEEPVEQAEFMLPRDGLNVEELLESLLDQALQRTQNNQRQAGELLGWSRQQVIHRLRKQKTRDQRKKEEV